MARAYGKRGAYKVKVYGTADTIRAFRLLGFKTSDLSAVFGRIATEVAADAKALAPRQTGALAADIRPLKSKTRAAVNVGRASIKYAGPINYGWRARNIEPSLFMQRAADPKAESSAVDINTEIQRLIHQAGLG